MRGQANYVPKCNTHIKKKKKFSVSVLAKVAKVLLTYKLKL